MCGSGRRPARLSSLCGAERDSSDKDGAEPTRVAQQHYAGARNDEDERAISRRVRRGQTFGSGRLRIDKERIKTFAAEFDPQPFHLDEEAARDTLFQGLAASGRHTRALTMRLLVEGELRPAGGVIGTGFDEFRRPAARATRGRAARRERSAGGAAVEVAPGPGADQGAHHNAEPGRRGRAGHGR
jgi:hypothetical protein